MSRLLATIDGIHESARPGLTAGDVAAEAFTNAVWAQTRIVEFDADGDAPRHAVLEMARYRDASLTIVASTTGVPSHVWLDKARLIVDEQVSA
jgi:hypothetical protein